MFFDSRLAPGVLSRGLTAQELSETRPWREALLPSVEPDAITRFIDPRLDKVYSAFAVQASGRRLVAKRAEANEVSVYRTHLQGYGLPVPELLRVAEVEGSTWLLLESIPGTDLQRCSIAEAREAGRAVGRIAVSRWSESGGSPRATADYLAQLDRDADVLGDFPEVRRAYAALVRQVESGPWGLAQADLLPLNVLHDGTQAWVIDWGYGDVLPVMLDPGRFLAQGGCDEWFAFVQESGVREAFLRAWLDEVRCHVDTRLTRDLLAHDVLLEEVRQQVECFRWVPRLLAAGEQLPDHYDPERDLDRHVATARQLARDAMS